MQYLPSRIMAKKMDTRPDSRPDTRPDTRVFFVLPMWAVPETWPGSQVSWSVQVRVTTDHYFL